MSCPKCGNGLINCQYPEDCGYRVDYEPKDFIHKPKKKFSWKKTKEIIGRAVNNPVFDLIVNITPKPVKNVLYWIKNRFKEPSTYKGISAVIGAIGFSISPELWEAIATLTVSAIGLIQVIENEGKKNK